jgi:hypothetical protein
MPVTLRAATMVLYAAICVSAAASETKNSDLHRAILPHVFDSPVTSALGMDVSWVVTVRMAPGGGREPDAQFSLTKSSDGELTAIVIELARPLALQLRTIPPAKRRASPAEIAKLIQTTRTVLTSAEYAELSQIAAAFENLRTPVVLENVMMLDASRYELWVDAGSQQVYYRLFGGSGATHPIICWIESTRKRLALAALPPRTE